MYVGRKKAQQRMFATEFGQVRLKQIQELEKEIGVKYEMYDTDQGSCEVAIFNWVIIYQMIRDKIKWAMYIAND